MTLIDKACYERGCACYDSRVDNDGVEVVRREWVGLTDDEFEDIELGCRSTPFGKIEAMKKVEAKLKEKNT
tara:strand:+ start:571 stop:783 length:213 start_codon:yes stop_codon:yes gene_type:complete